jgi:hypothetical protein
MANFNLLLESGHDLLLESGFALELEQPVTSYEYDIETLVMQILGLSAILSDVTIRHHTEDASTVSAGDRLTVRCDPKTPMTQARSTALRAPVWQADVTITAQSVDTDTSFDEWQEAIDTALMPATNEYPAAAVTAATASFPNGIKILGATGGDRFTEDKRRTLTRVYPVMFML